MGYLMPKPFLQKICSGSISPTAERNKEAHLFLRSINPKTNVIERLEFELAYYDVAVQHVNHNDKGTTTIENLKLGLGLSFILL